MSSILTKREWNDIVEYFAYRKSSKCMKLDNYKQFISGNYDWNNCVISRQGEWIYRNFQKNSMFLLSTMLRKNLVIFST